MTRSSREVYLGDGVYATWAGMQLALDCRAQQELPTMQNGAPCIILEPETMNALVVFYNSCVEDTLHGQEANEEGRVKGDDPGRSTGEGFAGGVDVPREGTTREDAGRGGA